VRYKKNNWFCIIYKQIFIRVLVGPILEGVKSTIGVVLSKLDEKQQKKEYYNISTLGNIEELGRIASDTASLLTLYYKEQIQSIDTSSKIIGSNIFNDKVSWIKNVLIDVRPEGKEEMSVVIVAEYVTAWVMETLKGSTKNLVLTEPLPQQLWLSVAKENCVEQGKLTAATDILGATAGRQKIPLKIHMDNGEEVVKHVQLRYLIGCVSVVTNDGQIYQYQASKETSKEDLDDLTVFGYVYVTPFLNNDQSFQSIIDGRKLVLALRDKNNNILTKLKEIEQYVQPFQNRGDRDRESAITTETARQVAQVLLEQKSFLDRKGVETILDESREKIENTVDILRQDIQEKTDFYQTTIDATSIKLQNEVVEGKEILKKDNEKHYNETLKKLTEQLEQIKKNLENRIIERLNTIEQQLQTECTEMHQIVEAAKTESHQALLQANEAFQTSKQSAQFSEEAREDVKRLIASTEQRRQEFQVVMERCETNVKQTIAEQKKNCEQSITAVRTKVQQDFERTKLSAEEAATKAKDSAQAAKESAKLAQETQKDTRKQLDLQKEETHKIISEAKEVTKQNERAVDEAKEASKQAKHAVDASTVALRKVDEMQKKLESALERLEKLSKKLETD
jgi:hypothetical protein